MKTFGFLAASALVFGAALYFGGYVGGSVDVNMTDKGRSTVNSGLQSAKEGLNSGLEHMKVDTEQRMTAEE